MHLLILRAFSVLFCLCLTGPSFAQSGFADGGFDTQGYSVGGYCYFSQGTCPTGVWSGVDAAGIIETGSPNWGASANSPRHYAFVQIAGKLSQTFTATQSGSFRFTWSDADRPNLNGQVLGGQTYAVKLNGTSLGSFSPTSTAFTSRQSSNFTLVAGQTYTLVFEGMSPSNDRTAYIDSVSLVTISIASQSGFTDGSFDTQGYSVGGYCYFNAGNCPTGAWSGTHASGIVETGNGSWGGTSANSPRHYAFIQIAGQLSQTFTATQSGTFQFNWFDADRPNLNGQVLGGQTYAVKLNGTSIASFSPTSTVFISRQSSNFTLVVGQTYTLIFEGMSPANDRTAYIDSVTLVAIPPAIQSGFTDGGFDTQGYSVGGYCYFFNSTCPSGAWSGVDSAGIVETSNGAWGGTAANSPRHYAVVQINGKLSQTFTATQSGSFRFNWYEANRPNGQGVQTYLVKVNGTTVATFTSSSASFVNRISNVFSLIAGQSYTLSFEGTSTDADRSAFIDSITLVAESTAPPSGFTDGGFDTQGSSVVGYCYFSQGSCPTGAWSGSAGIVETSNGAWNAPPANSPRHFAVIQRTSQLGQTFTAAQSGSFRFSWHEADRPNGQGAQTYLVKVNGTTVATFTSSSTSFVSRVSNVFPLVAGQSYTLSFEGTSSNADKTAFIDSVTLNVAATSGSEQTNFTYDALGRLTSVTLVGGSRSGVSTNYSFDAAGNRKNVTVSGAPN